MRIYNRGYSLIEILTVMAIIGILTSTIAAMALSIGGRGKEERAKAQIQQLEEALDKYRSDFRVYPPDTGYGFDPTISKGGKADYDPGSLWRYLIEPRSVGGKLYPSYLPEWPKSQIVAYDDPDTDGPDYYLSDPWDNPYAFVGSRKRVAHNRGSVDIFTAGEDGVTGCNDSILQDDGPAICNQNPLLSTYGGDNCMYNDEDDDQNGIVDDIGEIGPEARFNGDVGDDINNWTRK